jgi:hypothetical protein
MKLLHVAVGGVTWWLNHGDDVVEGLLQAMSWSNA